MKTDELINMLAKEAGSAPVNRMPRLMGLHALIGLLLAGAVSILILGAIPVGYFGLTGVQLKFAYALTVALVAVWALQKIGKPGVSPKNGMFGLLGVGLAITIAGFATFMQTPPEQRMQAVMGHSWLLCPWMISGLSIPILGLSFTAMRQMAPTNLRLAGAVCGLFSGAIAAAGFAFACSETAIAFVSVWYTLGILIAASIGALLGPRFLSW